MAIINSIVKINLGYLASPCWCQLVNLDYVWDRRQYSSKLLLYPPLSTAVKSFNISKLSVLWHYWLGGRKSIRPEKLSDEVLVWLSVCRKVQIVCILSSWCRCHPQTPSSLASFKSRLDLPFWYRLTQVVLEKRLLNGCRSSSSSLTSVTTTGAVPAMKPEATATWDPQDGRWKK